ncbi:MAG TPA: hypothetical protein VGN49_10505, partial [Micrococcaceae bacterium]|nr:hypothetical protein [Micrococcaceae bacterium]
YRSPRAQRLIRGPIGIAVLLLVCVATVVPFLLSDLPVSSTGLAGYHQFTIELYVIAGRLYPAYAAACLIRPTARASRSAATWRAGTSAGLICAAFCMVVLLTLLQVATFRATAPIGGLLMFMNIISYGAIIFLAVGLALVWLSIRSQGRKTGNSALANLAAPTTAQVSGRHPGKIDDTP